MEGTQTPLHSAQVVPFRQQSSVTPWNHTLQEFQVIPTREAFDIHCLVSMPPVTAARRNQSPKLRFQHWPIHSVKNCRLW